MKYPSASPVPNDINTSKSDGSSVVSKLTSPSVHSSSNKTDGKMIASIAEEDAIQELPEWCDKNKVKKALTKRKKRTPAD